MHFHALVLDGVYTAAGPFARPVFHAAPELEDVEVARLVRTLHQRILRLLRRRGLWPAPGEDAATLEPDSLLPFISAASIQGRVALGPDAGRRIERLGSRSQDSRSLEPTPLCAAVDGFSLHAQVHVEAHDRERLEHLCRYVARPAIASERLSLSAEGQVVYALRSPWRDGTTHFVFDPLTFIERLAALVPRPREHQLTYHGVLAPASSWRDWIVPTPEPAVEQSATSVQQPSVSSTETPAARCTHQASAPDAAPSPTARSPHRYRWAELMRRVFSIDVLRCEHCGERRKLIALITNLIVARRILAHLGLDCEPPPIANARPPPQASFAY